MDKDSAPAGQAIFPAQRARFVTGQLDAKAFAGADPERAAWTALTRALFNLDEAITRS